MSTSFLNELSCILRKHYIDSAPASDNSIKILLDGQAVGYASAQGFMYRHKDDSTTSEATETYHKAAPFCKTVFEYMSAMEKAPILYADGLDDKYLLLTEYNGVLLAAREPEPELDYSMEFVTWRRDTDLKGVSSGRYFGDNYTAAKEDFAIRSGLVSEYNIFSAEELTELYRHVQDALERDYTLTAEEVRLLECSAVKIECAVPGIREQLAAANAPEQNQSMNMKSI